MHEADLPDSDYRLAFEFRKQLRQFLQWSESKALSVGVTPAEHQLLRAIRGHDDARGPTIGDVASALLLRHHSAVGLVDRAVDAGLVRRSYDDPEQRVVRLQLTALGRRRIRQLSDLHVEELRRLAPRFGALVS